MSSRSEFVVTKEYRRFAELCDACRRHRYIGLCHGAPGVGKTLSARHYAQWDHLEPYLELIFPDEGARPAIDLGACRTVFYTPVVSNTARQVEREVNRTFTRFNGAIGNVLEPEMLDAPHVKKRVELLVVDEADRLKHAALEQLRDTYDRSGIALVLVGMPGIEKRLARYPQLYSRVGFVHQYRALGAKEMRGILGSKWEAAGRDLNPEDFTDEETVSSIIRITGGNFRLLDRLLAQIERVTKVNELQTVTKEVVEAARESLVIGAA